MRETKCELVRRELDELMLDEESSQAAAEHLESCAGCREFQRQQTKLRQMVGSLGTVNAPADFDFRLRARLAADSQRSSFHYWSFAAKGLATAAVLVVFGVGALIVWERGREQTPVAVAPPPIEPVKTNQPNTPVNAEPARATTPVVAVNSHSRPKVEYRSQSVVKTTRPLSTLEISSERANVISKTHPVEDTAAVFPIEASLQSLKVSLDDGRGNARTISVPAVSFGSQRVLVTANHFAPKGVW